MSLNRKYRNILNMLTHKKKIMYIRNAHKLTHTHAERLLQFDD